MLKIGDKVAIVGCSNAQSISNKDKIENLIETLKKIGLQPVCSAYIYENYSVFSGEGFERAKALMEFYKDLKIKAIFDISGGDIANEVLPYLDFDIIRKNYKPYFGYSDLTTIINAIYKKTGKKSYLYQIRNLIYECKDEQILRFQNSILNGGKELFDIKYKFIQGNKIEGILIGGNIRCLLKLAGTPYMPDFKDKILLLEGLGGEVPQMTTFLNQYKQMGVFNEIKGIILGTFTKMEENRCKPSMEELIIKIVNNKNMSIAKTYEVGHGKNSKALIIGENILLEG